MTQYEATSLSASRSLFGIRLFSDSARHVTAYAVSEFIDRKVLLDDLWGQEASLITERVCTAGDVSDRIERVESKLVDCIRSNECIADHLLRQSMQYMYASRGTISIPALADKLSYSERTIRRTFQQELGISPKELSSIIRFQNLLRELNGGTRSRLTDLALKYGYYDQSHFIRHFKRYYGLAPKQVIE
ncbi:helix-turn-helix transcriptional regulator [Paenibacillus spongiae]|uniref:Helix-turn-helix transcriptional regulator n=2 Tax=Paenibacillus spongiae TaxID=2909671 RepID=A0ABY5SM15_9BACL|nr:helix-turn-helix transcriptional regulator [Paenibacillus spongiae]